MTLYSSKVGYYHYYWHGREKCCTITN